MTNPVRKNKQLKRRGRRGASMLSVPPSAVVYRGPIQANPFDTLTALLPVSASVSTASLGEINGTFNNNPSGGTNWSEYSTAWREYRVLGVKFTYIPRFSANTTTLSGFSGYHGIIYGTGSYTPTTLPEAAATGLAKLWDPFHRFTRTWKMGSVEQAGWIDTGSPFASSNCITLYAQDGTPSTLYGNIMIEYLVQFRSHRK